LLHELKTVLGKLEGLLQELSRYGDDAGGGGGGGDASPTKGLRVNV
jgi:hypothetical protein